MSKKDKNLVEYVKKDGETKVMINTEKATLEKAASLGWKPSKNKG